MQSLFSFLQIGGVSLTQKQKTAYLPLFHQKKSRGEAQQQSEYLCFNIGIDAL
jgi:hypothetical protein